MYAQRCNHNKQYLNNYYQPKSTFLSPANKFGQRSLSTSSLPNALTPSPLSGSLREQIRLQTFKKNLNESKLNKMSMSRVPLKVGKQQRLLVSGNDVRSEIRELQRENAILRAQNEQLKKQRTDDLVLIARQNEVLVRLQKQINDLRPTFNQKNACDCYLIEQHLLTIRSLQLKNKQLQEQKHQFKKEIRQLVLQQQRLKVELQQSQKKVKKEKYATNESNWRDMVLSKERKKTNLDRDIYQKQFRGDRQRHFDGESSQSLDHRQEQGRRYLQHLKNKQIDLIANILQRENS